eukprot:3422812-Amphidinium_carterae.1
MSTGESEFDAVMRGTACGLQTKHLLEQMDVTGRLAIHTDSSAARGFCQKIGVGKRMKHMHHRFLCIQQKVRDREVKINPVETQMNVADLGTKYWEVNAWWSKCDSYQ